MEYIPTIVNRSEYKIWINSDERKVIEMIYEKVKKLAKAKGISINQIEKDLGFSSSSISKWNSSNPTSSKLKQVADYLGVTMDYLLEDEKQGV